MLLGGPPRSPRSGTSPKGPWSSTGHVQFGKSPQTWPRRTRPRSPEPAAPSGVRGSTWPRRRDSPRRAGPTALSRYVGHLWMGRRPPCPEARGPVPRSSAASRARRSLASPGISPGPLTATIGGAVAGGGPRQGRAEAHKEVFPGQRVGKMAAPMELFCWSGGWGLPSVDLDSLAVLTYARFTGAPLKVHKISNPWQSPSGTLPALRTSHGEVISVPHKIITHLRKEVGYALYSAIDYVILGRPCNLSGLCTPLFVKLEGWASMFSKGSSIDGQVPRGNTVSEFSSIPPFSLCSSPASLDAFVFSYLALLLQAKLPSGKLQVHLRGLHNLCAYCTHILSLYFPWDGAEVPPQRQTPAGPETEEEPYRRRNQILSVLAGLAAMVGYALLSGIVSIQRATPTGTKCQGWAEVRVQRIGKEKCQWLYVILSPSSSSSSEKYHLSSKFWAGGDRARMLRAPASVTAPPNPFTFWNFWLQDQ
uniref:Metaxin-1 n=1 Tax=Pan paniscus TaxID=9597 RepID=A0A2R9A738_PANPA